MLKVRITYISLNVRLDGEEADDTCTTESGKNEQANDHVVPSCGLHPGILFPEFVVFSNQSVALEDALRVCT
jgi:hypothetical protein